MSRPIPSIRILLADDHPVVRAGMRAVLSLHPDLAVVDEAATPEAAVQRCLLGDVDVVLMDLQFAGETTGIEATAQIRGGGADAPQVLMLTTYDAERDVLGAIEAGAAGYLLKDADPDALAQAVRAAARGETTLAPSVAQRIGARSLRSDTALTSRELEVIEKVAAGMSNQQISAELFLSQATVKTHLVHIFAKLGVESRTAAVAEARSRRLIRN